MKLPFFKKRKQNDIHIDFNLLHTDMHAHFLPGLDDGAPDLSTSVELVRALKTLGYKKLIATPHISQEFYPNPAETIGQSLEKCRAAVAAQGIDIALEAAAEYMIDDAFIAAVEQDAPLLCFGTARCVLIETGFIVPHPMLQSVIFQLKARGYQPVLAHPERYTFYYNNIAAIQSVKDAGCLLQLNLLSLTGYYGPGPKQLSCALMGAALYDLAGTDVHHHRHIHTLSNIKYTHLNGGMDYIWLNSSV
jgi:protein-tyrosine phosphatase